MLICLGMNILWDQMLRSRRLSASQQIQTSLDMWVVRIELGCPAVGVKSVVGLVVTRLVLMPGVSAPCQGVTGDDFRD